MGLASGKLSEANSPKCLSDASSLTMAASIGSAKHPRWISSPFTRILAMYFLTPIFHDTPMYPLEFPRLRGLLRAFWNWAQMRRFDLRLSRVW